MLAQGRAFLLEERRVWFDFWLMSGYGAIYRVTERLNQKKKGGRQFKAIETYLQLWAPPKSGLVDIILVNGGASAGEIHLGV
jgi:hypothetical protein